MYLYVDRPEEKKVLDSPKVEDISVKLEEPKDSPNQNKIEDLHQFEEKQPIISDRNI